MLPFTATTTTTTVDLKTFGLEMKDALEIEEWYSPSGVPIALFLGVVSLVDAAVHPLQ